MSVEAMGVDRDPLDTVKAHRELLAAVRARDTVNAKQRMRDHFRNLEGRMAAAVSAKQADITVGRN